MAGSRLGKGRLQGLWTRLKMVIYVKKFANFLSIQKKILKKRPLKK